MNTNEPLTDPVEIINATKAYLRDVGWTKDMFGEAGEPKCVIGAVVDSYDPLLQSDVVDARLPSAYRMVVDTLADVIKEQYPDHASLFGRNFYVIFGFNDLEETTQAEVETVLDKARVHFEET